MIHKETQSAQAVLQPENSTLPEKEKKSKGHDASSDNFRKREKNNEDYWNRIAEDPASGYKNEDNDDPLLNVDQQPDDNKRGDEAV